MTLPKNHQPKYQPYKDRDRLQAFLLDTDAKCQRMADVLDLFSAELRTQAIRIGQLIDPPTPLHPNEKSDLPATHRKIA